MDILTECEGQLLELIDKLRNIYKLTNVLDTQYQSIRRQRRKIVLAVAGSLKAGKSSFINYLIGSDVCPVGINETTARLTKITYSPQKLVKLESSTGKLKEEHKINNDEGLKEITKKLIALKRATREESSCQDIVTIHLDRVELENIELWDTPGYDGNPFLNSMITKNLKETNIFFILTSTTEVVRDTVVNLFRSCSKKHEYQPQVCFIATKIDQVTTNKWVETTIENVLDRLFKLIKERFKVDIGDEWKSSPFFIPLCIDPMFSMKDFLESYEQFTQKLMQFFTNTVRVHTILRLKYLINTIHELLDYDDLDRSIQRDEKSANTLTAYLDKLCIRLNQKICEQLNTINVDIRRRKEKLSEKKGTTEARMIAQFVKENNLSIVQLYLNLLDKVNRFEYPHCEINLGDELGRSNFPVFGGTLSDTDRAAQKKNIAVKRVPLYSFMWQEVRHMSELKHENILLYYGVRKSEQREEHYDILMQRLDSDLTRYIDYACKKGRINDQLLNDIFIQITNGLKYLHEQGLIHRDIKPENVLVQLRKGQSPFCVLADFGFVHLVLISIKGTLGFLAPELLVSNAESILITPKVDIFALGVTIKQIIENSTKNKESKYVKFWVGISGRCLLRNPFDRPTCQKILEKHNKIN